MSDQLRHEHGLVIERCVVAIHDYGTRHGASAAKTIKLLKADGFTPAEIKEAASRFV